MSKRLKIILIAAVLLLGGIVMYPKLDLFLSSRKTTENIVEVPIYIDREMTAEELGDLLFEEKVIDDVKSFIKVADYKAINQSNIALGKYIISPKTEYRSLLNGFRINAAGNGNAEVEVDVTFNNCRDIYQLSGKVSKSLLLDSLALVNFLTRKATLEYYDFTQEELPALFLPNTYKMYYDTDEKEFVERMAKEFKNFWNDARREKMKKVGLESPSEVATIASIVYSEQNRHPDEWPIIAGLYLNRLEQGIKLQSDPTFKFCWGDALNKTQRLLNEHKAIECPYNTYKIEGLPPGPICIPPADVIDAVLNRAKVDYIFMMARPDYSYRHDFSKEYRQHERLAKIYQQWLANELKQK